MGQRSRHAYRGPGKVTWYLTIKDDRFVLTDKARTLEGTIKLDESKKPKWVDATISEEKEPELVVWGIVTEQTRTEIKDTSS